MTDVHAGPQPGWVTTLAGRWVARIGYGAMQLRWVNHDGEGSAGLVNSACPRG